MSETIGNVVSIEELRPDGTISRLEQVRDNALTELTVNADSNMPSAQSKKYHNQLLTACRLLDYLHTK